MLKRSCCRKHRRRRISVLVLAELVVQIANLLAFLVVNAVVLITPCGNVLEWLISLLAGFQWICWNTVSHPLCASSSLRGQAQF